MVTHALSLANLSRVDTAVEFAKPLAPIRWLFGQVDAWLARRVASIAADAPYLYQDLPKLTYQEVKDTHQALKTLTAALRHMPEDSRCRSLAPALARMTARTGGYLFELQDIAIAA